MDIKDVTSTDNCIDVGFELTQEDMQMLSMEETLDQVAFAARLEI